MAVDKMANYIIMQLDYDINIIMITGTNTDHNK
jgi:hypothetical protein